LRARETVAAAAVLGVTWGLALALLLADEHLALEILRVIVAVSLVAVGALAAASILYSR
jgi:hypothetical protein